VRAISLSTQVLLLERALATSNARWHDHPPPSTHSHQGCEAADAVGAHQAADAVGAPNGVDDGVDGIDDSSEVLVDDCDDWEALAAAYTCPAG
jgi:hypothetical protein